MAEQVANREHMKAILSLMLKRQGHSAVPFFVIAPCRVAAAPQGG